MRSYYIFFSMFLLLPAEFSRKSTLRWRLARRRFTRECSQDQCCEGKERKWGEAEDEVRLCWKYKDSAELILWDVWSKDGPS